MIYPDANESAIEDLAYRLGIRRIGWIFTDLIANNKKSSAGPVLYHRGNAVRKIIKFDKASLKCSFFRIRFF